MLPFWTLAFVGVALSTISVAVTDAWSVGAHLAPPVHTMTLLVAHLSGFGVLWVAQFILLDRILFGRDAHSTTQSLPLRGHVGHTDPFPRGNWLPAKGSPQAPQAREIASDEQGSNFEPPWGM